MTERVSGVADDMNSHAKPSPDLPGRQDEGDWNNRLLDIICDWSDEDFESASAASILSGERIPWVEARWQQLADAGFLTWFVPSDYGGSMEEHDESERLRLGLFIAQFCLTTSFLLSQRNASILRLAASSNTRGKEKWLRRLTTRAAFSTVGISHFTTSRQFSQRPVVEATRVEGGYLLNGLVPWVSGAHRAEAILTGGALVSATEPPLQLLAMMEVAQPGVIVRPPEPLLGLRATQTGQVELHDVFVGEDDLVAGPVEQVMKGSTGPANEKSKGQGAGSLSTTSLAVGASLGILHRLALEAEHRPELQEIHRTLQLEAIQLMGDLYDTLLCRSESTPELLRQQANSLVSRTAQVYLAACKGAGFIEGHAAARFIGEAMFFTVWSCPQAVVMAGLKQLACHQNETWD